MATMGKRVKKYREAVDSNKIYSLNEAVKLIKEHATAKFDESVDIAMNLNVDPRKADQNLRGMVQLPSGSGKTVRVAVFAKDANAEIAKKAGADIVGGDDLAELVQKGEINFDMCIATPDMMPTVGKIGKILGPKGLMPNPKLGTVTTNVEQAVKAAKSGQVEYRTEKTGIIHTMVGKASFTVEQLEANIIALADTVIKAKPSTVKGTYVKKVSLSSTMGPSFTVVISDLSK